MTFNPLLTAALDYAKRGWPVIALHTPGPRGCSCEEQECQSVGKHPRYHPEHLPNGLKSATLDEDLIKKWWGIWPEANVAIITGRASDLVVLDVDPHKGGTESLEELEAQNGPLPQTVEAFTGGGGRHLHLAHPGGKVPNKVGFKPGLDIRGDGGYIVAPPSRHLTGSQYRWRPGCSPQDLEVAELPSDTIRLLSDLTSRPRSEGVPEVLAVIREGARNSTLTSLAGTMRRRGMSQEAIEAALLEENQSRCLPPLCEREVQTIAKSVSRYDPAPEDQIIGVNCTLTDLGNAMRLVARHGSDLRYCYPWGSWLFWDGQRWARDNTGEVERRAKQTVATIYAEASKAADREIRQAISAHAVRSESEAKRRAMIASTQSELGIPVLPDDFDRDPWLLNLLNGTLDLRTGELRPHKREDLITKLAPVEYDPQAECPTWLAFLEKVMDGNPQLIEFLQTAVGYALTGDIREQCLFFLHGLGANGKSTFLEVISALVGDYGKRTSSETLLLKRHGQIPNDLADLRGARFVTAVEVEAGRRMSEVQVKEMTGGDRISARFLFGEWFTFQPEFKIFLGANHKPIIRGTDHAIWRRIRLIPFTVQIPKADQDKELLAKLKAELPGILNWALEGCRRWQAEGLTIPPAVEAATQEYQEEMDLLGDFLAECCLIEEGARTLNKDLYAAYGRWAESHGEKKPLSRRAFGMTLTERGFQKKRMAHNEWYRFGLRLNQEMETPGSDLGPLRPGSGWQGPV